MERRAEQQVQPPIPENQPEIDEIAVLDFGISELDDSPKISIEPASGDADIRPDWWM